MSKPMLVTLPCLLLLLDYWPLKRFTLRASFEVGGANFLPQHRKFPQLVIEKVPFFLLAATSCVITFLAQKGSGAMVELSQSPIGARFANAGIAYVRYLEKTFWPAKLAVFYPYSSFNWTSWETWAALALLGGVSAATVLWAARKPYLVVGWFWFLGTLVPVIGLVQVGKQSLADRYTYMPHIALFLPLAWGLAEVAVRLPLPRLLLFL